MKKHFTNTIFAAWAKVFIAVFIGEMLFFFLAKKNLFLWDLTIWQQIISSAIAGTLPVIANYFNPYDPRYGNKKKSVMMLKDNLQNKKQVLGGGEGDQGFVGPVPPPPNTPTTVISINKK